LKNGLKLRDPSTSSPSRVDTAGTLGAKTALTKRRNGLGWGVNSLPYLSRTPVLDKRVVTGIPNRKVSTMNTKEQFALALRVIGVLGIIYIVRSFVRTISPPAGILIVRLVCAIVGVYFIRGACLVVNFAYPGATAKPPESAKT